MGCGRLRGSHAFGAGNENPCIYIAKQIPGFRKLAVTRLNGHFAGKPGLADGCPLNFLPPFASDTVCTSSQDKPKLCTFSLTRPMPFPLFNSLTSSIVQRLIQLVSSSNPIYMIQPVVKRV